MSVVRIPSTQYGGEKKIKALQKELLSFVETHPILSKLEPWEFNSLRRRIFRTTFYVYRLGVVGLDNVTDSLWANLFDWLSSDPVMLSLPPQVLFELGERYLITLLEALRAGSMQAAFKNLSED